MRGELGGCLRVEGGRVTGVVRRGWITRVVGCGVGGVRICRGVRCGVHPEVDLK